MDLLALVVGLAIARWQAPRWVAVPYAWEA
jgi:hypothetical protein